MDGGSLRAAIVDAYLDQHVLRRGFGVLDKHIKIAVIVEDSRVNQLVLHLFTGTPAVCLHQIVVWERPLRIFVQILHVGMRWSAIQVEIILFYVLAVVALTVGQAKHPLFEYGIYPIPQRQAKTKLLAVIRDSSQAILAPTISPRTCLVMGEIVPGVAILAIVLPDRAPLPLTQVGTPFLPWNSRIARIIQPLLFRSVDHLYHQDLPSFWVLTATYVSLCCPSREAPGEAGGLHPRSIHRPLPLIC